MSLRTRLGLIAVALCAAGALHAAPPAEGGSGVNGASGAAELPPPAPEGAERMAIGQYIREHAGPLEECYARRLDVNPSLRGKLVIRFDIGPDGKVSQASADGIPDRPLIDCVVAQMLEWRFARPASGGRLRVAYPIAFQPG